MKETVGRAYKRKSWTTSHCTPVDEFGVYAKLFVGFYFAFDLKPRNAVRLNRRTPEHIRYRHQNAQEETP